jgi:hypothetical protein
MLVGNKAQFLLHIVHCSLAGNVDILSEVFYVQFDKMEFLFLMFTDESSIKKFVGAFFKIHKTINTESDVCIPHKE